MSAYEIVIAVVVGIACFTFVYALIRVPWRLRRGDVEPAYRDSETFKRRKPERRVKYRDKRSQ